MRRLLALLATGAATVTALAASAGATPPSVQVVIRHQLHGDTWSANGAPYRPTQMLAVSPGTIFTVVDHTATPHRLVQVSGPKVTGALQLFAKGRYVFTARALRLVVTVR